ncbi:hypothetical protein Pfo_025673 [Paulownia fortunei]|nr:hypothetical protein Pfo_025673 [Paulownia fortunei]
MQNSNSVCNYDTLIMSRDRTTHSRFKIPIDANKSCNCTVITIFMDKTPIAKRWAIKNADELLKGVMKNDKDFGGKVIIFCGDSRQVLPVVPSVTIYQTISASLVKSYSRNDSNLSEFLPKIRNNKESNNTKCNIKISEMMIIEYDDEKNSILRLIRVIFPTLNKNVYSTHYMTSRTILAAKHEHVDKLNNKLIFMFSQKAQTFNSFLVLKKNYPIILLKNLDQSNGLYNGTKIVCKTSKIT